MEKKNSKSRIGENNPTSILLVEDVLLIRLCPHIPDEDFAEMFHVSKHTVEAVRKFKTWTHVPDFNSPPTRRQLKGFLSRRQLKGFVLEEEGSSSYDKIKAELMLGNFSDKQFREIKAIADIRLGNFSAKESADKELDRNSSDTYAVLFYERLRNVLATECKIKTQPYRTLKAFQPKMHKEVFRTANFLYGISEDWNKDKGRSRNFSIGVFHLYSRLVVKYLQECKVPVSMKTCLQHSDKFIGMVGNAFPGYVESDAISLVVLGKMPGK